jgi:tetratricopeptide (TPR) repeat protein
MKPSARAAPRWLCGCLLALALVRAAPAFTVVVMDFETPDDAPDLAWARQGIPDLLLAAVEQAGWTTLDRTALRHLQAELALTEQNRRGELLGARHTISGRVSAPAPGRLRIEISLTEVERMATVGSAVRDGVFPDDVDIMLSALTEELFKAAGESRRPPPSARAAYFPAPEAMIAFHRGLAAYTEGQSAAALLWFIRAHRVDPQFEAARAWEVRSLEALGHKGMAERMRDTHGLVVDRARHGQEGGPRTVAMTTPRFWPEEEWPAEARQRLGALLQQELRKQPGASLINPGGLEQAIREHDHQLGGFFTSSTAARYGRWQTPDGILQCRAERTGDQVRIRLWLDGLPADPSSVHEEALVSPDRMAEALPALLERLLGRWAAAQTTSDTERATQASAPLSPQALAGMSPEMRAVAEHLGRWPEAGPDSPYWAQLGHAWLKIPHYPLAGWAIDRALETWDPGVPDADMLLYSLCRLFDPCGTPGLIDKKYSYSDLIELEDYVSPDLVGTLTPRLLTHFPKSQHSHALAAFQGSSAWREGRYEEAVASHRFLFEHDDQKHPENLIIHTRWYMLADSLRCLQQPEAALRVVQDAWAELGDLDVETAPEHLKRHVAELRTLEARLTGSPPESTALDEMLERFAVRTSFSNSKELRAELFATLDAIAGAWKTTGAFEKRFPKKSGPDLMWAEDLLRTITGFAPLAGPERNTWWPAFIAAYLRRAQTASVERIDDLPPEQLALGAVDLLRLHAAARLRPEGLAIVERLMKADLSPEAKLKILNEADMSGDELAPSLEAFSRQHPQVEKDIPGSSWQKVADAHVARREWDRAMHAVRKAMASAEPPEPGRTESVLVLQRGFATQPADMAAAVRDQCEQAGLLPWMPPWEQWFAAGHHHLSGRDNAFAVACFRGALRLLEAPAEGPEDARRRVDRECMMVHLAVALLSVDQHDEAVELLRTVSLSDGQETMFRRSINHRLYGFPSKKAATTLLHALHLARDPDWKNLPAEERVRRAMICQEAGEMMRGLCHPQMTYFFDAAKRLHPGK